jgi:hypothetical protein
MRCRRSLPHDLARIVDNDAADPGIGRCLDAHGPGQLDGPGHADLIGVMPVSLWPVAELCAIGLAAR